MAYKAVQSKVFFTSGVRENNTTGYYRKKLKNVYYDARLHLKMSSKANTFKVRLTCCGMVRTTKRNQNYLSVALGGKQTEEKQEIAQK